MRAVIAEFAGFHICVALLCLAFETIVIAPVNPLSASLCLSVGILTSVLDEFWTAKYKQDFYMHN